MQGRVSEVGGLLFARLLTAFGLLAAAAAAASCSMATSKLGSVQIASPRAQDLPRKRLDLPTLVPGDPVANPSSLWFKSDGYYDRAIEAYEKANPGREAPGRHDDKSSRPWKKSALPRDDRPPMKHYFSTIEESPRAFGGKKSMDEVARRWCSRGPCSWCAP